MVARNNREAIERTVAQFAAALHEQGIVVRGLYLFGSAVRGTMDEWSDIDVAVVVDDFAGDRFSFFQKLMRIARGISIDLEPHPFRTADFMPGIPGADEILHSGRKVA